MPLMEDLYAKQRARQLEILPFFYSAIFTSNAVATLTTVTQNVSIQSDSHFVCRYLNITPYTSPGSPVFTGLAALAINLFDSGSGRTLLDNNQAIQNICGGSSSTGGTGNLPFIFPEPWLLRAGSTIVVTLQNLGLLTFPTVHVSLCGFKVFQFGQATPGELF